MRRIFKYQLEGSESAILMPVNSKIINVDMQNDKICLWAIVNTDAVLHRRFFVVVPTGGSLGENTVFLKTVMSGEFVWHIFEWIP